MTLEEFRVGPTTAFPPGSRAILDVGGRSIGVFNVEGRMYALNNVCPHALAPVCMGEQTGTMLPRDREDIAYGLDDMVIRCPWHGWEFDIATGEALFGTDRRKVQTFPVRIVEGQVVVSMRPRRARESEE